VRVAGREMTWLFDVFPWGDLLAFAKSNAFLFGAITAFAGFATWLINREVGRRTMARLSQDQQAASDHHILRLCEALSDNKQSLQLAAAALLVDRARTIGIRGRPGSERVAILQALLAATMDDKRTDNQTPASPDLCKFIADSVVEIQGARISKSHRYSPLKDFYWQQVRLTNADWKDVDARELDLFGSNFERASLRRANLRGAIFNRASLRDAVLCGADLRDADLRGANLSGADLRSCDRTGKIIATQLAGARLNGANLTDAKLEGVDLGRAVFDQNTTWPTGFEAGKSQGNPSQAAQIAPLVAHS
jgi:hypothetical protein